MTEEATPEAIRDSDTNNGGEGSKKPQSDRTNSDRSNRPVRDKTVRSIVLIVAICTMTIGVGALFTAESWAVWFTYETTVVLELIGWFGLYLLLALCLLISYRLARHRFEHSIDEASPPPRESVLSMDVPGDELARTVQSIGIETDGSYGAIRDRLGQRVRNVLVSAGHYTDTDAERAVQDGTWTDDPVAAAVIAPGGGAPRSRWDRLLEVLGFPDVRNASDLRRTMVAVASAAGIVVTDPQPQPPRSATKRSVHDRSPSGGDRSGYEVESVETVTRGDVSITDRAAFDTGVSVGLTDETVVNELEAVETVQDGADGTGSDESQQRHTGHWDGVGVVALLALVIGVLYQQSSIIAAATVGIGFAAYGRTGDVPDITVRITRNITDSRPEPGDDVGVTLTVQNDGNERIHDLRIVDGVPSELTVSSGSPRLGSRLAPGDSVSLRYTVKARRGRHDFEPAHVIVRSVTGRMETEHRISSATSNSILCLPPIDSDGEFSSLLDGSASSRTGPLPTTVPGSGVEFHSVREYQPGDPVRRIDWRRFARTRELSTVSFHEDRSTDAFVVIDARSAAFMKPEISSAVHAVDRSVSGAASAFGTLLSAGHHVGIVAIGPDPFTIAPGSGRAHRYHGRYVLGTSDALGPRPPRRTGYSLGGIEQFSTNTQLLFFSPFCDDGALEIVRVLRSIGSQVSVISPDPTAIDGPERALARVERNLRLDTLRSTGIHVIDWSWDQTLVHAMRGQR